MIGIDSSSLPCFFFLGWKDFGLALFIPLYYSSIRSRFSTLLQGFLLVHTAVKEYLNLGSKPVTVEVVLQEVETVPVVKIVEASDNKKHGLQYYNGTHVYM